MAELHDLKNIIDDNLSQIDLTNQQKESLRSKSQPIKKVQPIWKMALIPAAAVVIVCTILFTNMFGTQSVRAEDNLMNGIQKKNVEVPQKVSDEFVSASADFSIKLFQKSIIEGKNSLISPPSVYFALGMTANGADGETLSEFEKVLGGGKLKIDELNSQYQNMKNNLESVQNGKLKIANSIWFRDDKSLTVKKDFLQTNADYFGAAAYKQGFSKPQTADAINNWVKQNTDGMIDKIVDKIDPSTMMYLINTIMFEEKWASPYERESEPDVFYSKDGEVTANYMNSSEQYIHDSKAQGIIKPYKDKKYSFVAIMPNEEVKLSDYIKAMTGESFASILNSAGEEQTRAFLPKFKYDFQVEMSQILKQLGLIDAFSGENADFSKMGALSQEKLFIASVLHKTFIQVDELGVKAGAATAISMGATSAAPNPNVIKFNRPFICVILDNTTKLPVFIGTVEKP